MSSMTQVMRTIDSHRISNSLIVSKNDKLGGLLNFNDYVWYAYGSSIVLYSKGYGCVMSHRSFANSVKITCVKELPSGEGTHNFLLIGCSFKSSGILFVCQLPTLTVLRCIDLPNKITSITSILNNSHEESQLCDEFKIMSTVLLVGMVTGAVYAVDLRQNFIETQLKSNEFVENESKLNQLFVIRKNEDCQEVKEMSDDIDSHLALYINENFHAYCKKQYNNKLSLNVSSLLYIKEINTIAVGYSTGHFQLWDCKIMRTIFLLKEPKCVMPITHISFLEPSDDPNNLCYLWVIQSDNSKLPYATMMALTYEQKIVMPNGSLYYKDYRGSGVKLEMSLKRETGIGRCVSALSLCNVNLFRNKTDMDEDCEIKLFAMLLERRSDADSKPESFIFLFDINQWYKAQMPSIINHLKVSNSYASFVKLPHDTSYLDFNISDRTLRPFGYNFRNNVEELYYPSSIYFECECLTDAEIVNLKHAGIQQEILDQLLSKNWKLLTNPTFVFSQCVETNLRPFFWDKPDDYANYSVPDKRSFVVSIIVENQIMPVLSACAEEWKNGTYVSSEATILHLVKCLWKHVMVVKQYADKLCVPLFDYSGTQLDKKNIRIFNHCLCQMQCIKNFLQFLHNEYGIHVINVDYSHRIFSLNLVTDYFKAVRCFLRYNLLPESLEDNMIQSNINCNFKYLIMYANKRRIELGGSQSYFIDAIVLNEPKGNKLIEQWLHEGGEETKGLYPPSNVQCLLRIYLNASLSELVKNFIVIYFLIDVCASQNMNVSLANRMCNFALEVDIPNYKELNLICRASWLLDHDMFEEAIGTFTSDRKWIEVINKYGDWFHWTVLKLLVFKSEYSWARFYLKLVNMNIVNIDDHKFYVNIQIMNNHSFDVLMYIRALSQKDQDILYEYFFHRCRETHKLKCLLDCIWKPEEGQLLDSFLKKFNDAETLNFQLLFLINRQKYIEAYKLYKSIEGKQDYKNDDMLAITGVLVNQFYKSVPEIFKQDFDHPIKTLPYKKSEVIIKTINNDKNKFCFEEKKRENILYIKNSSITTSQPTLILPSRHNKQKHSPSNDLIYNEKRRKTDDVLLSPPRSIKEIPNIVEKNVLEILNTPLVRKSISSPSILASCSSILKTGSAKKSKRLLNLINDETTRTVLRFSLPGEKNTTIEQFVSGEEQKSRHTNEMTNIIDKEPTDINSKQLPDSCSEVELVENSTEQKQNQTYEKMEISEEFNIDQEKLYDIDSNLLNADVISLISDNEIEEKSVTKLIENHNSTSNEDYISIELETQDIEMKSPIPNNEDENSVDNTCNPIISNTLHLAPVTKNGSTNICEPIPFGDYEKIIIESSCSDTSSEENIKIILSSSNDEDEDIVDLETEDEISNVSSDSESSENSSSERISSENSLSSESDLDETKYGRFKFQNKHSNEDLEETSQEVNEEDGGSEQSNTSYIGDEYDSEHSVKYCVDEDFHRDLNVAVPLSSSREENEVDEEAYDRESSLEGDNSEICDIFSNEDEDDNLKYDVQHTEENNFENNLDLDEENESIPLCEFHNSELFNNIVNNFRQEVIENMVYASENEVDDDFEIECSSVTRSDSCKNIIHNSFELTEENSCQHYESEISYLKENVHYSVIGEENVDINVRDIENTSSVGENMNTSTEEDNFMDFESNKDEKYRNQFVDHSSQDMPPSTSDNYNNTFINKANLHKDVSNNLMMPETDSNVLETNNVSSRSLSFLFGQQEVIDNKPIFLFGQVYSSENEQIVTDTIDNRNDNQDLMTDTCDEIFPKNESEELELVDEIQDIIELKSLPDSNPDENISVDNCLKNTFLSSFTECSNVNSKTLVTSEPNNTKIGLKMCHSNIFRASSEPKQFNMIVLDCSERAKSVPPKLQDLLKHNISLFDSQNDNKSVHKSVDSVTDHFMSTSNPNILNSNSSNMKVTNVEEIPLNCLESQSDSENEVILQRSLRAKSEQLFDIYATHDLTSVKSISKFSKSISTSNLNTLHSDNSNNKKTNVKDTSLNCLGQQSISKNEVKLQRSIKAKSLQPFKSSCVALDLTYVKGANIHLKSMSTSNLNILHSDNSNNPLISSEQGPVIENERKLRRSKRAKSEQLTEKTAIDMKNSSIILDQLSDKITATREVKYKKSQSLIGKDNTLEDSQRKLRRSTRSKSEQPLLKTAVETEKCNLLIAKNISTQNVGREKDQPFIDGADMLENHDQQISLGDKKVHRSSRKSIQTSKDDLIQQNTPNIKKTPVQIKQNKPTSKYSINEQVDNNTSKREKMSSKAKSISVSDNEIKVTRLRAKSESNIVHAETDSLNIFRPSEMVDDSRQKRVILPKKKFNDKQNDEVKLRKGRSKSLAPMKESLATKTAFGLEQIIEEDISNSDKQGEGVLAAVPTKSKFNFLKKKPKKDESNVLNVQEFPRVRTPRRAKSVQPVPPPAATLSLIKPKRKSSVSYGKIRSDDRSTKESDDLMEFLKKPFVSAKKPKKRISSEPLEKERKPKISKKVEQKTFSRSVSPQSNKSVNDSPSSSYEIPSPIAGNNSPHLLYTPAAKKLKHSQTKLNFDTDDSSSDELNSERITRSKMKTSVLKLSPDCPSYSASEIQSTSTTYPQKRGRKGSKEKSHSPKNLKKSSDQPLIVEEPVSARPMTRLLQSKLDNSEQFTPVTEQDEPTKNQEKKKQRKNKN